MTTPDIGPATSEDIPFLVEAIVSAEKSGTDRFGLANLCGLSEEEMSPLIAAMLNEEVDGCEYSVSSFLVARSEERAVAAVAGWVEGRPDEVPSMVLKANLIAFTFPKRALEALRSRSTALTELQMPRERGALQIEFVHTAPGFRGGGVANGIILDHLQRASGPDGVTPKAQVQLFSNNRPAKALYEKLGFITAMTRTSHDEDLARLLPFTERLLMERPSTT